MSKRISLANQAGTLRSYFPDSHVSIEGKNLTWVGKVTPTPISATYTLRLRCSKGIPKVFVTDPFPLAIAAGQTELPHVYDQAKQQLCLYYPKEKERQYMWTPDRLYVHTLIPWAAEWLLHYELWLCTGTWHGGGIEHNEPKTSN